jgi:hypothetical protein
VWIEFRASNPQADWSGYLCDSIRVDGMASGETIDLATSVSQRMAYTDIPYGFYTLEMRVDATNVVSECNEANNIARLEGITILPDRPDLVVTGFDFSPQDVSPDGGTTMTFTGTVVNKGTQPTTGSFWIEFRVWSDPRFEPTGPYLCDSCLVTQTISPGERFDLSTIPARTANVLPTGVYYVGIVIDAINQIAEQREDNNMTWLTHKKLYVGSRPTDASGWMLYR